MKINSFFLPDDESDNNKRMESVDDDISINVDSNDKSVETNETVKTSAATGEYVLADTNQNVYFDYLWIDDFCRMLEMVLKKELQYHTYNIVSGQKVSLREICDCVRKISNKDLNVYVCRDGLANEYTASNERCKKECKDFIYTPIEKSIESLYYWYVENEEMIDIYKLLY